LPLSSNHEREKNQGGKICWRVGGGRWDSSSLGRVDLKMRGEIWPDLALIGEGEVGRRSSRVLSGRKGTMGEGFRGRGGRGEDLPWGQACEFRVIGRTQGNVELENLPLSTRGKGWGKKVGLLRNEPGEKVCPEASKERGKSWCLKNI